MATFAWYLSVVVCVHLHFSLQPLSDKFHSVCFGTLIRFIACNQHWYAPLAHSWVHKNLQQLPAGMPQALLSVLISTTASESSQSLLSNSRLLTHKVN